MAEAGAAPRGLRERKKQQTRQHIAEAARRLFTEQGFDRMTVADVARAADVSVQTVFNYFPTKEDLVYWRMETFEEDLLAAVRERAPGESVLEAFGRFVLERRGLLAQRDPEVVERLTALTHMITESPALLAREQQVFERYTASLAAVIAEETHAAPHDVEPWVAARALMGVHRALLDFTRARIVAGASTPRLAREMRAQGKRAIAALERGLGRYAVK
ncbi:TetR/AcrR family transcriptional regulator [soil metagenome]